MRQRVDSVEDTGQTELLSLSRDRLDEKSERLEHTGSAGFGGARLHFPFDTTVDDVRRGEVPVFYRPLLDVLGGGFEVRSGDTYE